MGNVNAQGTLEPLRIAVRVGVTGNRELPADRVEAIEAQVRSVLGTIKQVLEQFTPPAELGGLFGSERLLKVISPIAAGGDQIVATEALALGYQLEAPLPFSVDEYRKDFPAGSAERAEFDRLREAAVSVLELDGDRADASAAYERVGRIVLEQCDVLIAIWDEDAQPGRGGAAQMVSEAVRALVPVIEIPAKQPSAARLRFGLRGRLPLDALAGEVRDLLFPYCVPTHDPEDTSLTAQARSFAKHMRKQLKDYRDFLAEPPAGRRLSTRSRFLRWWVTSFSRWLSSFKPPPDPQDPPPPAPPASLPRTRERDGPGAVESIRRYFQRHHERSDALATHYTDLYRSAYFMNYRLGAAAVTCAALTVVGAAVTGLLHELEIVGVLQDLCHEATIGLSLLEVLCIIVMVAVFKAGNRGQWHDRSVDYRILAEQFRQMPFLAPLGLATAYTRPPPQARQHGDLTQTWMNWHFRAVLRNVSLADAVMRQDFLDDCHALLRDGWIEDQRHWHARRRTTYEKAYHHVEHWVTRLFIYTGLAALSHAVLELVLTEDASAAWPSVLALLTVCAIAFPALAAAGHGVLHQSEFERLMERFESMSASLGELGRGLAGDVADAGGVSCAVLHPIARQASQEMMQEVVDWRVFARAHEIPLS